MDAVTGIRTELVPVPELAQMGVARVSIPVASIMVAYKAMNEFFLALKGSETGTLAGATEWVPEFDEFTRFVGLDDYRRMEDAYLPSAIKAS